MPHHITLHTGTHLILQLGLSVAWTRRHASMSWQHPLPWQPCSLYITQRRSHFSWPRICSQSTVPWMNPSVTRQGQQEWCLRGGPVATVEAPERGLLGNWVGGNRLSNILASRVRRTPEKAPDRWFSWRLKVVHVQQAGCSFPKQRGFYTKFVVVLFCSIFLWDKGA